MLSNPRLPPRFGRPAIMVWELALISRARYSFQGPPTQPPRSRARQRSPTSTELPFRQALARGLARSSTSPMTSGLGVTGPMSRLLPPARSPPASKPYTPTTAPTTRWRRPTELVQPLQRNRFTLLLSLAGVSHCGSLLSYSTLTFAQIDRPQRQRSYQLSRPNLLQKHKDLSNVY